MRRLGFCFGLIGLIYLKGSEAEGGLPSTWFPPHMAAASQRWAEARSPTLVHPVLPLGHCGKELDWKQSSQNRPV